MQCLPEKLNPVIKPIMESIKREECEIFQQLSADFLVKLMDEIHMRAPCPNNKIVTNICTLLKSDSDFTPQIVRRIRNFTLKWNFDLYFPFCFVKKTIPQAFSDHVPSDMNYDPYYGILTLSNQQKANEGQNGTVTRGPGRPPAIDPATIEEAAEVEDPVSTIFSFFIRILIFFSANLSFSILCRIVN